MEAVDQLLTAAALALVVFLALFRRSTARRRSNHAIWVSDAAIARSMIIDHADTFSNRPMPPYPAEHPVAHSISSMPYGPLWRALRCNLSADILHRARVGALAPLEREAAEALAATLAGKIGGGGVVDDLRGILHRGVFSLAVRLCFGDGMDARDMAGMLPLLQEFLDNYAIVKASERSWLTRLLHWRLRRRYLGTFHRLDGAFMPAVLARRRMVSQSSSSSTGVGGSGFRSYVDTLLELRIPGEDDGAGRLLTDKEIVYLVFEFIGAATYSAKTCLEWALAHLAAKPEIQEKLHWEVAGYRHEGVASEQHLPYLHAVVLESLRLHPPIPFMKRDVHAGAIALDKAAQPMQSEDLQVSIVLGAIGRDGKLWTNPDEFNPDRFLEGGEGKGVRLVTGPKEIKMMPFGAGRRRCPGWAMGTTHIKCFLAELVREFEWAPAPEGSCIDFAEVDGFRKMMKTPLRARITPRNVPIIQPN